MLYTGTPPRFPLISADAAMPLLVLIKK